MLGVSTTEAGLKFSLFSAHASAVQLRLFNLQEDSPFLEVFMQQDGPMWTITLPNLPTTFEYTYRCDGPYDPKQGHLFNKNVDLVDPYATCLNEHTQWNISQPAIRGVVRPTHHFDWGNITRPMIPLDELIIYEMHVRGFSYHHSSQVNYPGTFLGMIEKIPHLKKLGINAVEILPIHVFNEQGTTQRDPTTGHHLVNYWGYSTSNFFTPMPRYGTPEDLKLLVKSLHQEGIEVILDVVYNHTSEGSSFDHYHSFRGIDNATYYMTDEHGYFNYSGCGNTLNCNHPIVQDLILDSLRYFVMEYQIDGFRFDLASILTRDQNGTPLDHPPLIQRITTDPILGPTKLIAEAWDAGGLYQVGTFPSWKFGEWNDQFRDTIRHFIRGDGIKKHVQRRLEGSPDLYSNATKSYNFVTIHDGFSLCDLVSYNHKHNSANGEDNRDGMDHNISWNCGVEGPTDDPLILELRAKQMRNAYVALLTARGIPMLLMGDEYGHSKEGNNNTWCQDNTLSYFLWDELENHPDLFEFVTRLITIRKQYLFKPTFEWIDHPHPTFVAYLINTSLLVTFNPSPDTITYDLPSLHWTRLIDTHLIKQENLVIEKTYTLAPYSSAIFLNHTRQ